MILFARAFVNDVRSHRNSLVKSDFRDATETLKVMLAGDKSLKSSAWEIVGEQAFRHQENPPSDVILRNYSVNRGDNFA